MNKDAEVQRILYELGYKQPQQLTPSQERLLEQALDPEKQFLADVQRLFEKDDTTFNQLYGKKNKWIKMLEKKQRKQIKDNLYALVDNAYGPIGGHVRIKDPDSVLDPQLTYWEGIDDDADPEGDAVLFGRETKYGIKVSGWGHDGTSKRTLMQKAAAQLSKPGYYIEASERPAQVLIDMDVPYVDDQQTIEQLYGEQVEWRGDGRYVRRVSPEVQITFGRPLV